MEDLKYNYVAFEGLIGAGKSTLTQHLSKLLNAQTVLEEFEENPFLPLFYKEPERYAFQVELSFLAARYHQLKNKLQSRNLFQPLTIADYALDKCWVFGQNNLGEHEKHLFNTLYQIISSQIPQPELIIYLHLSPSKALERIKQRDRDYEQNIKEVYLIGLQERYKQHWQQKTAQRIVYIDYEHLHPMQDQKHLKFIQSLLFREFPKGVTRLSFDNNY
jgi:deoxyadenosine/deoxycytidine kinase